jgi:succinoglycan biosynthesis protein ExoO
MTDSGAVLVSVIIPAYKSAETLEKAVNSALQIDNMEVVIVDDYSPDNSFEIASKLAQNDSRVRVFRLDKNYGVSHARNYAIQQSRGEWIAVLDADDWFEENRLKNMIDDAVSANVELAADNQYFFDKKAGKIVGTAFPNKGRKRIVDLDIFLKHSNATKHFDYGMFKPIFRTDFIRKHSIEYYVPDRMGQDYYILLCFFAAGGKAILTDIPYYSYVQPFGYVSRKGQQEDRRHYNHVMQKSSNEHFIAIFCDKLSITQMSELLRRAREIEALICFYELREVLRHKNVKLALGLLLKSNFEFWQMIVVRALKRIWQSIFGLPPHIISD